MEIQTDYVIWTWEKVVLNDLYILDHEWDSWWFVLPDRKGNICVLVRKQPGDRRL